MKLKINQNILKKYLYINALNGSIKDRTKNHHRFGSEGSMYVHMEDKDESFGCAVRICMDIYYEDPNDELLKSLMSPLRKALDIDETTKVTIYHFEVYFLNGPDKIKIKCEIFAKGLLPREIDKTIKWTDKFRSILNKILTEHGITIQT